MRQIVDRKKAKLIQSDDLHDKRDPEELYNEHQKEEPKRELI